MKIHKHFGVLVRFNHTASLIIVHLAVAIVGAVMGVLLAGEVHHRVGPINTTWAVDIDIGGGSRLDVPIIDSSIDFPTHGGLLRLRGTAEGISHQATNSLVNELETIKGLKNHVDNTTDNIGHDVRAGVKKALWRLVLGALTGSFALGVLVWRKLKHGLVALGVAASMLLTSFIGAAVSVDKKALQKPQYVGALKEGIKLLGDIGIRFERFNDADAQITEIVSSVASVYHAAGLIPHVPDEPAVRILLVSDVHDWEPSFGLMQAVIDSSDISFVIDAGDITKYGTSLEGAILEDIAHLGVPYVFAGGNHDSKQTGRQLAKLSNVTVLRGRPVEVEGFRILGSPDPRQPRFHGFDPGHLIVEQGQKLAQTALADGEIDLAVVHNPIAGRQLGGTVPLVLAGHLHNRLIENMDGTMLYVEGSTSGAVLDIAETVRNPLPRQMSILEFDPLTQRLIAYTQIDLPPVIDTSGPPDREVKWVRTVVLTD